MRKSVSGSMRVHSSIARLVRAATIAMAVAAAFCACKKQPMETGPDADAAPGARLPAGALLKYSRGGGITGETIRTVVFADGRVERTVRSRPAPPVHVPVIRVEKLAADLASTGVFAQQDGTWKPGYQGADGVGSSLTVRDKAGAVHAFDRSTGGTPPDAIKRALEIAGAFDSEVALPETPCACQPGDPRCSCL